jgi:hypothetical protein
MGILGVVGTANDTGIGYGRYETKRLWQFKVEFAPMVSTGALGTLLATNGIKQSLTWSAKSVKRPVVKFSEIELKHGNETWKIAGKTNWASEAVEIVFDDVIPKPLSGGGDTDPLYSASSMMYDWQAIIQNPMTGNSALSSAYKANIIVTQYNPASAAVERYLYHGAWPSDVNYGEGWEYDKEDAGNAVTTTFTFDKFYKILTTGGTAPPSALYTSANELTATP